MAFKMFTNAAKGLEGNSIALNAEKIISVFEKSITIAGEGGNREENMTILYGGNGESWEVSDPYLEVVSRLNQRD